MKSVNGFGFTGIILRGVHEKNFGNPFSDFQNEHKISKSIKSKFGFLKWNPPRRKISVKQNPFWMSTFFSGNPKSGIRNPDFQIENTLRELKRFKDGSEGILQKKKRALEPVDCTMLIRMVNFPEAS